ncbi:hypothetical protein ACIBCT_20690 [Streptosporangium sp. NPDC050855]|uniref:hypothetical protein n=1 Tax=Streptosporangium sp. NPDC050855 TaxID=3366194 RepID=UPI0037BC4DA1
MSQSNEPVVLVPGRHLLDAESYASAGFMRQLSLCAAADLADEPTEYVLVA